MFFIVFIMAHLFGDFVFQTNKIAAIKTKSTKGLLIHVLIIGFIQLVVLVPLFGWQALLPAISVAVAHYGIDYFKLRMKGHINVNTSLYFILDQGIHLAVVYGASRLWQPQLKVNALNQKWVFLIIGLIICYFVATILSKYLLIDLKLISKEKPFFIKNERKIDGLLTVIMFLGFYLNLYVGLLIVVLIGVTYPLVQKKSYILSFKGMLVKLSVYIGSALIAFGLTL